MLFGVRIMKKWIVFGLALFLVLCMATVGYSRDPKAAVKLLYEAWEKYGDEQITILREVIEKYPESGCAERARRDLANALYSLGRVDETIKERKSYIEKYPVSGEAQSAQSWIAQELFGRNRFEEALEESRRFLNMFPDCTPRSAGHTKWRIIECEFEKLSRITPEEAVDKYRQLANESDYYRSQALWKVALIYENSLKDPRKAIAAYRAYLDKFPEGGNVSEALWRMSENYREIDDVPGALGGFGLLARNYPGSRQAGDALMRLALTGEEFANRKQYDSALAVYQTFTELYPAQGWHTEGHGGYLGYGYDREILRRIANLHQIRKEFGKAIEICQQILSSDEEFLPGSFTHLDVRVDYVIDHLAVYRQLATMYSETGKSEKAKEVSRRLERLDGDIAKIKKKVTAKFGEKSATISFRKIDIENKKAVVDIAISYSPRLGCGYRVWLSKGLLGWSIDKSESTWQI